MVEKVSNIVKVAREAIKQGRYVRTAHAVQRMNERGISLADALKVISSGWHDEKNDEFDHGKGWSYAIVGSTYTGQKITVPISIKPMDSKNYVIIVTVKGV